MRTVALISCCKNKLPHRSKVKDLYVSSSFKVNMSNSNLISPDVKYVLSAKHGLLKMDDVIDPYDVTLNNMSEPEVISWSNKVFNQLRSLEDIPNTNFVIYADDNYSRHLSKLLVHYHIIS